MTQKSIPNCTSLITIEKYKQTWAYIRDLEKLRVTLLQLIATLSTAGAALPSIFPNANFKAAALLISLFSLSIFIYFITSKKVYNYYISVLRAMEQECALNPIPYRSSPIFIRLLTSPFSWWALMPLLFSVFWLLVFLQYIYLPTR